MIRRLAALLYFARALSGAGDQARVLVVVNVESPLSRQIVEIYTRSRNIRPEHVCPIRIGAAESASRADYEQRIEAPVRRCLESSALRTRPIDYIVLTAGMPLRVTGTDGRLGTLASVDSELTLLRARMMGRRFPAEGAVPNPFFGQSAAPFHPQRFPLYMVARLAAYDLATVRRMIEHAQAPANRGRVVLDMKENETDNAGDLWLSRTALQLPRGRVVIDSSTAVLSGQRDVIAYAGWGSNDPHRNRRWLNLGWLPGSIATEFVSTNARTLLRPPETWIPGNQWRQPEALFAGSPQSMAADYLAEGATAATGHTDEPQLQFTPRPDLLLPAYLSGRTLGESYYLSIAGLSWRNVLFGDPLCRLTPPAPATQGK